MFGGNSRFGHSPLLWRDLWGPFSARGAHIPRLRRSTRNQFCFHRSAVFPSHRNYRSPNILSELANRSMSHRALVQDFHPHPTAPFMERRRAPLWRPSLSSPTRDAPVSQEER